MRLASFETIVSKASPNRLGPVYLIRTAQDPESPEWYVFVAEYDEEGYEMDGWESDAYTSEADARLMYDRQVADLMVTPNWQAQAEYDEAHGTINGYAPWQVNGYEY